MSYILCFLQQELDKQHFFLAVKLPSWARVGSSRVVFCFLFFSFYGKRTQVVVLDSNFMQLHRVV